MDEYHTQDKDVLEYYHSPLAAQGPFYQLARLTRNPSARSASSSDHSSFSDTKDSDASSQLSHPPRCFKSGVPSVGNADRRPIAMAQVEQNTPISAVSSHTHPSNPQRQDHPASSDVVSSHRADAPLPNPAATNPHLSHHNHSVSESLPSSRASSRDRCVVGTLTDAKQQSPTQMPSQSNNSHSIPVVQQPETVTVLPPSNPDLVPPLAPIRGLNVMKRDKSKEAPADASRLGANKENHVPVDLGLDTPADHIESGIRLVKPKQTQNPDFASTSPLLSPLPSSDPTLRYVNYQPGIHSTAGPLPPPPRLPGFDILAASSNSPPPPRPPRLNSPLPSRNATKPKDIEVVKQALQLPPSVSAALASRSQKALIPDGVNAPSGNVDSVTTVARSTSNIAPSSPSISESSSSSYCMLQHTSPIHRREGAFPSTCVLTDASPDSRIGSVRDTTETPSNTVLKSEVSSNGDIPQDMTASELPPPSPILESAAEHVDNNDAHSHQSVRSNRSQDHGEMSDKSGDGDEEDSNENWVSVSRELSPSPGDNSTPDTDVNVDEKSNNVGIDRELPDTPSEAPSPPPKNFRSSLTTGLKRFSTRSLPRTPSVSSGSRRSPSVISKRFSNQSENRASFGSGGLDLSSPSICSAPLPSQPVDSDLNASNNGVSTHAQWQVKTARKKVVQQWPSAMSCNEMHGRGKKKMTSSEKCAIYRRKINELYMYDCGLSGWVEEMKFRGPSSNQHGNGASHKKFLEARSPTDSLFIPKPRQTSRSSMISEATFPTRPDASTATDLLSPSRDNNDGYLEDVPILPYPSLATAQRAAASNVPTNQTPPSSIRSYGSNSTLPSVTTLNNNLPHASVNTITCPTQPPSSATHHTSPSLPLNRTFTTSTGGGFFAALSRKASLSSTKRPMLGLSFKPSISSSSSLSYSGLVSPSIMQRHPTKSSMGSPGAGRSNPMKPVSVGGIAMDRSAPPSIVPGGPRALSNAGSIRLQRSKTYIPSKSPQFNSVGSSSSTTVNNVERRPSLWELHSQSSSSLASPASSSTTPTQSYSPYTPSLSSSTPYQGHGVYTLVDQNQIQPHYQSEPNDYIQLQQQQQPSVYDPQTDLEFIRQINKLAELLPNANRTVLTGYLRRAGQDVLAIGQYLEDEKNGTLKAY